MSQNIDSPSRGGAGVLGGLIGALILGALAITFVLSFVAIVFSGPASVFLEVGIAHALLGAAIMALVGAVGYSQRGTLCQPQDVTAILLAGIVSGIASDSRLENADQTAGTLIMVIALTSMLTGVGLYLSGRFRVGALARYLPYPVVAGFLAATGVLLVLGAVGMVLKAHVSLLAPGPAITASGLAQWLPWFVAALALTVVLRLWPSDRTLPLGLLTMLAGFYAWLMLSGTNLTEASEAGLLLGPFEQVSFVGALRPDFLAQAQWWAVVQHVPTILAITALALIGSMMNGAGLERALSQDTDPEADLRATGKANMAAGIAGGLPGYQIIGETVLASKLGFKGGAPSLVTAGACLLALVVGASALEALPIGFFAAVVGFLGMDLIWEWGVQQRHRLRPLDMALVLAIVVIAVTIGFLQALMLGLFASVLMFLTAYAGLDVVRLQSTAAHRRSRVERGQEALDQLARLGRCVSIFELEGFVFFGTAFRLRQKVLTALRSDTPPTTVILDFARVGGADASARETIARIAEDAAQVGAKLVLTSANAGLQRVLTDLPNHVQRHPSLDTALEHAEAELLDGDGPCETASAAVELLDHLADDSRARAHVASLSLKAGETLIHQGAEDRFLYVLISGQLRADLRTADDTTKRVALFAPGALIGELAYYANQPRSADVVAETEAQIVRIDLEALATDCPETTGPLHAHVARLVAARLIRMNALARDAGF